MIDEWKKIQRSLQGIAEPEDAGDEGAPMTPEQEMWASWDSM